METNIIINTVFSALHHWGTIPEDHSQIYLKSPHRHTFHIQLKIPVRHDDRDIEFIELKRKVDKYLNTRFVKEGWITPDLGAMSCEMFCKILLVEFDAVYCKVMEDGENGAEVISDIRGLR